MSAEELSSLSRMHERVMWLGSGLNSSRAFGSHQLAYVLASLEQQVPATAHVAARRHRPCSGSPPPPFLAGDS